MEYLKNLIPGKLYVVNCSYCYPDSQHHLIAYTNNSQKARWQRVEVGNIFMFLGDQLELYQPINLYSILYDNKILYIRDIDRNKKIISNANWYNLKTIKETLASFRQNQV